jgi:hypothetical protein
MLPFSVSPEQLPSTMADAADTNAEALSLTSRA